MVSLTGISITSRKAIRFGIYFIMLMIFGRVFLNQGIKIYNKMFPAPPAAPTVKYGKLTKIPFPETGTSVKLTYTLETAEGGLPTNISTQAKVYFMPKASANLLSLDTAKGKAAAFGFGSELQRVTDTIYTFKNPRFPATLQINIISNTFSISYDLTADASPISLKPPVAEVATSRFKSFLSSAGALPSDLTGPVTHDFLKISNGQLVSALSLSEANFVKINLFRRNYDDLPMMTGNPNQANVWAIISGGNQAQQIIASEYHYHAVDESQFSTYPVKTPQDAFAELQNGQAFIANQGVNKEGENLKIRHIYLAYFDPDAESTYLQPIYVFEGDNGFMAYTPAVAADYYQGQ
jgi:hypothetical protein